MSKSLLDYVQDILSSMDSDEVNSISDTTESLQVARVVRTVFDNICVRADLNEHYSIFQVEASGDADKPTVMYRPSDVLNILWIKYNSETTDDTNNNFKDLKFYPLNDYLLLMHGLKEDADNVLTFTHDVNGDTMTFMCENDRAPIRYTTFDDSTILFNSYDADVDTTLQKVKTLCYGKRQQVFTMDDDFVPFIDLEFQQLLLNESKSLAFVELKQVEHTKAEKESRRMWIKGMKNKRGINNERTELDRLRNFGRK